MTPQISFHLCFIFKILMGPRRPKSLFLWKTSVVCAAAEVLGRTSTEQLCSPAGFLAFLWFVAFCFLANQWQRTTLTRGFSQGADAARAAITFSFFSIIIWVRGRAGIQPAQAQCRAAGPGWGLEK